MHHLLAVCVLASIAAGASAQQRVVAEIRPFSRPTVATEAAGRVAKVAVAPGDRVEPGQVLVELDAPALAAVVDRARARVEGADVQVRAAELELQIARRELSVTEREQKIAAEHLPHAKEQFDLAEARAQQTQTLHEAGRTSVVDLQQAQLELSRAKEAWATLGETVKAKQDRSEIERLAVQKAELAILAAQVLRKELLAELHLAELDAAAMQMRSPVTAMVDRVLVAPGEQVGAPGQPLVELVDLSRVRLVFAVDVATGRGLVPGAPVTVAQGGRQVAATIAAVAPTVDLATQTRRAEIVLANADGAWLAGTLADVVLRRE